jgi:hypothetical protein
VRSPSRRASRARCYTGIRAKRPVLQTARRASSGPYGWDLEALAEVDERVAGDDRTAVLDREHDVVRRLSREHLDSDGQRVAGRERGAPRPCPRLAARPRRGCPRRGERNRRAEPFHQARVSRSCHGHVSTTTGSRSAASSSISLGTSIGSKSSRRLSLSIA